MRFAVVSRGVPFLSKNLAGDHHPLTVFICDFLRASRKFRSYSAPIRTSTNSHSSRVSSEMKKGSGDAIQSNTDVNKMQELVHSDPSGGWDKCWEQGLTPWDLGQPTPVLMHLYHKNELPRGRVLVPGCGSGHDVVSIAGPDRYVVGLEISDRAIKKATELSASLPNEKHFTFLKEDFFSWRPPELFDLIFDYTFFCAIEPNMRPAWGRRMGDLLKPDGELITLIFPISDHVGGPPYSVSIKDYEEALHPMGFKAILMEENKLAVGHRKGREKLGRWKKFTNQSSMM